MLWLTIIILILVTFYYLRGEDLAEFDFPPGQSFATGEGRTDEHREVEDLLKSGMGSLRKGSWKERLSGLRKYMDSLPDSQNIEAQITPAVVAGLDGEWVLAPGAIKKSAGITALLPNIVKASLIIELSTSTILSSFREERYTLPTKQSNFFSPITRVIVTSLPNLISGTKSLVNVTELSRDM